MGILIDYDLATCGFPMHERVRIEKGHGIQMDTRSKKKAAANNNKHELE